MVILTGASGGIGEYVYTNKSKEEFVLGITHKKSLKIIKNTKIEKIDLANEQEIKNFIIRNKEIFKNITLIHMAAIKIDKLMYNFKYEELLQTFSINCLANFYLTKYMLPFMIKERWGRIINISSLASEGALGSAAYASSKAALQGYTKSLAKEYGRFNITTNLIKLGYFDVGLINNLSDESVKELKSQVPSKKLGMPSEVLKLINYIQSSDYLNGAIINLDGGV